MGNPASLDKDYFFTDYFSLGYMQYHPGGCGVLTHGQLKIFKMAVGKRGRFVLEMFISGRKHESSCFGLLEYGVFTLI